VSVVVSQFLSNVPLVALYLPLVLAAGGGVKEMMVLAAGSTIAGNLSLLGAASNVIIVQNAEKRKGGTISFLGVPSYWFSVDGSEHRCLWALVYAVVFIRQSHPRGDSD